MSDITQFITALEAAQNGAKYNSEVQKAAAGINTDDLKLAYAAAQAQGKEVKIEDDAQSAALKAGFEFAAKLVMELQSAPGNDEKTNLYVHYKIGSNVDVPAPGMFDMVVRINLYLDLFCSLVFQKRRDSCLANIHIRSYRRSTSSATGRPQRRKDTPLKAPKLPTSSRSLTSSPPRVSATKYSMTRNCDCGREHTH